MILRRSAALLAAALVLLVASAHASRPTLGAGYTHSQPLPPLEDPPADAPADDLTIPTYRDLASAQLAAAGGRAAHAG